MNYLLLIFIIALSGCGPQAEKIINHSLNQERLSYDVNIEVQGSVKANVLNVKGMTIQGSATLGSDTQSVIDGAIHVQGSLKARNIDVKGKAEITGSAEIEDGKFDKDVIFHDQAVLEKVIVKGDVLVKSKKITLKNSTTILGAIVFENEPGTVYIKGKAIHLRKGIVNGKWDTSGGAGGSGPIDF